MIAANTSSSIAKSAFLVTAMMLAFKLLAFIKQAVIAYFFGATVETDAYFIAWGVVSGVSEAVVKALLVSVVAIYTQLRIVDGREQADRLINGLLEILVPIFIAIVVVVYVIAPYLAVVLAPSFAGESKACLISFIRILSPILIFGALELIFGAVMDSYKSFYIPRMSSLIYSLSVISICFLFVKSLGVNALVAAQYFSNVCFTLLLIIAVRKYHNFSVVKFREIPELKNIIITAIPLFIGNSALQINQIVDKSLSSGLGGGAVSALSYCHTIEQFVTNIMIVNIGNVMFASFAALVAQGEMTEIKKNLASTLNVLIAVLAGISIWVVFCSGDIVTLVYRRGNFGDEAVKLTAIALVGYAVSFVPVAVRDITTKSLYAFKDTKQPMITSIISICINIAFSVVLSRLIGLLGIALATSISAFCGMVINALAMKKHLPDYSYRGHAFAFLKCFPAMVLMAGICFLVSRGFSLGVFMKVMLSALIGFPVYFAVLYICRYSEIRALWNLFEKKITH